MRHQPDHHRHHHHHPDHDHHPGHDHHPDHHDRPPRDRLRGDERRGRGRGPRGGGFGGGRRRDRGEVRIAVLKLLAEGPMHGYGIMREVAVRSNGTWRLSPGAVYPTLNVLEADGLVTASGDSGRSVYELTERGRRAADELAATTPPWECHADDQLAELGQAVEALAVAARQIAEVGDARQQAAAVAVMVQARRRLYALLAEEPGAELADDANHDQP